MVSFEDKPILHPHTVAEWEAFLEADLARRRRAPAAAQEEQLRAGPALRRGPHAALCFGWIDGQSKRLDDDYMLQAFTPRRSRSPWSQINRGPRRAPHPRRPDAPFRPHRDRAREGRRSLVAHRQQHCRPDDQGGAWNAVYRHPRSSRRSPARRGSRSCSASRTPQAPRDACTAHRRVRGAAWRGPRSAERPSPGPPKRRV